METLIAFSLLLASFWFKANGCQDSPVGIADSSIIPDDGLTATSSFRVSDYGPQNARLNGKTGRGWGPRTNGANDHLQIDLGRVFAICAVATQGANGRNEWTTQYKISTSVDNRIWTIYKNGNTAKLFPGNTDRNTVVKNVLDVPVLVRYIRFIPTTSYAWKILRVEAYGLPRGLLCSSIPLGIGSGKIPDSDMTSSSSYNSTTSPSKARLNYTAGSSWCAATSDSSPYLQINLGSPYIICGIATQGYHKTDQWVQSYQVLTSTDGATFATYMENNQTRSFAGNVDSSTAVNNVLYDGTVGQYIRVTPTSHYGGTNCMRTELYGIQQNGACKLQPLGLSSPSLIPDHRFTASSYFNNNYIPSYGRLLTSDKGWGPTTTSSREWLQIDVGSAVFICAVATQGIETLTSVEWVTRYKIRASMDNMNWEYYQENNIDKVFLGNRDQYGIVRNSFIHPLKAKFIRFYPIADKGWPSMRVEVYGTQSACSSPVGLEVPGIIQNSQMTSSSHLDATHTPSRGRLYGNSSWCSSMSSNTEYIQINLGQVMTVTGIATQGDYTTDKWVTTYTISYSLDGNLWNTYKDGGNTDKVFQGNSDRQTVRVQWLSHPVTARHVRITPQTWNTGICMRIELYGCDYDTRPVISGLTNQNLTAASNSCVDLVCMVQEPLIQYIKWYTGNTDITSQSTGLVRGANGVKQSTLRVNYTTADDVLNNFDCIRSETVLCSKAFVCRAMYEDDIKHPTALPNAGVMGRISTNGTSSMGLEGNTDGLKSVGVNVRLDYPTTLEAPTVHDVKSTSVTIRWSQPSLNASQTRVTKYLIECQNSTHTKTIDVPAPASIHVITGLAIYSNYSVQIKAISRVGAGEWSKAKNFTTNSSVPEVSPLFVAAQALTSQTMRVTWQAPTSGIHGVILGYKLILSPVSSSSWGTSRNLTTRQTTCIIGNLLKWTEYDISVSVFNDKGEGPTAHVRERTLEDAPSQPPQYFNVTVVSSTSVQLSWALPPIGYRNGIVRGFEIYYKKASQESNTTLKDLPGNGTLRHVLGGLDKYTTYTFKVLAYTIKEGPYSKSLEMTTLQDAPSAPTNLQIILIPPQDLTGPQMNITWNKPLSPNGIIQLYMVFCNNTHESSVIQLYTKQTVTLTVIGGLMYSCWVKAKTIAFGNKTTKKVFIPIYAPTTAPQNLKYSKISATTFVVTWQPLNTTNGPVTIYELIIYNSTQIDQRTLRSKEDSADGYEKINATCCNSTLYRRSPCSVYVLSVRGYTCAGAGPVSNPINVVLSAPAPPTRLRVSNVGQREVTLNWDKPDGLNRPVIEYKISFNGTNLWEKSVKVHRGQVASSKETAIISGLLPSTQYNFQVVAETECGAESKVTAANTSVDAPPSPLVEYVTNINESISNIPLWKASNVNGLVRAYQVFVIEMIDASRSSFDVAKLTDYYKAKESGLHYYITAQINVSNQAFVRSFFTLGDENIYDGYRNVKLVHGKRYHVFQRATTIDGEMELLTGRASLTGKGQIHEHGGPCITERPLQKIVKRNDSVYLFTSLTLNTAFFVIFIILLFHIKSIKRRLAKRPENSEVTASTSMQVIYENPNAPSVERLPMTFLPQGRNSDYEQIDLINAEVLNRPAVSACNSLYQSIHLEEESQPELNSEKEMESLQEKGIKISSLKSLSHERLQKGNVNHQYQGLGDCKGINGNGQANAYQPLQREKQQQPQPEYINRSSKKVDGHLATHQRSQQTQPRPVYQSLNGTFEESMTPPPAHQSLAKVGVQAVYENQVAMEENVVSRPAHYRSLQLGQARPSYENLREERKESAVQNNNYQALEKPAYQSLHTYANTGSKQKGDE